LAFSRVGCAEVRVLGQLLYKKRDEEEQCHDW
jgi:hypothetical protein